MADKKHYLCKITESTCDDYIDRNFVTIGRKLKCRILSDTRHVCRH